MCKHKRFEDTPSSEKNPTEFLGEYIVLILY